MEIFEKNSYLYRIMGQGACNFAAENDDENEYEYENCHPDGYTSRSLVLVFVFVIYKP